VAHGCTGYANFNTFASISEQRRGGVATSGTADGRSLGCRWLTRVATGTEAGAITDRLLVHEHLVAAWRPRRPTILLLDDPLQNEAVAVVRALASHHTEYRYPVRLI